MSKYVRDQALLDRFTTKKKYREFLNKKVKDFSPEERSIYNRIAQQEKRNPFGKEITDTTSQLIGVDAPLPFADIPPPQPRPDPRRLLRSRRQPEVVGEPIDDDYIPTIADMRKVLRAAGKLDRTPPQLNFTPIVNAAPKEDEVRAIDPLPINERRNERVIANTLRMGLGGTQAVGLDDRKAFLGALSIIGEKKRAERAEEIMADLAASNNPPTLDEARAVVDSAIGEYDREARAVSAGKAKAYKELMDSEVGDIKRALDRFNIPSDYLLKPTKKQSRKAMLKASQPEWYEKGLEVPKSPREKREDLQFGIDDPEDIFDPDPVITYDEDDEWLKEYLREDVMEARAREQIKEGIIKDPRPRRRAIEEGMSVEEANRIFGTEEDILTRKEVVFDGDEGTTAEIKKVVADEEGEELERLLGFAPTLPITDKPIPPTKPKLKNLSYGELINQSYFIDADLGIDNPNIPRTDEDLLRQRRILKELKKRLRNNTAPASILLSSKDFQIDKMNRLLDESRDFNVKESEVRGAEEIVEVDEPIPEVKPYIPPKNVWKEGTREHARYADKLIQQELSEGGRFPPNIFTEERGRLQFGFDPQRTTLPTTDVEEFALDAPYGFSLFDDTSQNIPSWALDARSGKDTYTETYRPPDVDVGYDFGFEEEGGRSMFGGKEVGRRSVFLKAKDKPKEDEVREAEITDIPLPMDIRTIINPVGEKEVVADEPEVEVIEPVESLANTTTAGSGFVGEAPAKPKLSRYEMRKLKGKKKKKKKGTLPEPKPEVVASTLPTAAVAAPTAITFGEAQAGFLQPIAAPMVERTFEEQLRMGDEFVEPEAGAFGYSRGAAFAGIGSGAFYR